MLKKIIAVIIAAVSAVMLAACSDYVMTEEDLEVQRSIQGCWSAGSGTGYNTYDAEGNPTMLLVVEFTDDFKYFVHKCDMESGFVMTYDPISYSFKDKKFKVDVDGVASYAKVNFSDDGNIMYWVTDGGTDSYDRLTGEEARALGIPEYDREYWATERAETQDSESGENDSE